MLEASASQLEYFATVKTWFFGISYALIAIGFVEFLFERFENPKASLLEGARDYMIGIPHELVNRLFGNALIISILGLLSTLQPFRWSVGLGTWLLCFLVADFVSYWHHRLEHGCRFFWAHHKIHHSSTEFRMNTSFRLAIHECFIYWIYVLPLLVVGFNFLQALLCFKLIAIYHQWVHNRRDLPQTGPASWLSEIFVTPTNHRLHHGVNSVYLDRNYGAVLIVWDRIFGTYVHKSEAPVLGLAGTPRKRSLMELNFGEYKAMASDVRRASGALNKLRCIFGPPPAESPASFHGTL